MPNLIVVVRKGDTLGEIAARYHTTAKELGEYNHIEDINLIHAGDKIKVPMVGK